MRLIDADALIREMHNIILEDGEDRRTFYGVIERQPTIDAVEVKHGQMMEYPVNIDVDKLSEIATKYNVKIDFEVKEDGGCEVWIQPMKTE